MIAFIDITAILCSIHTVQFQQDKDDLPRFEDLAKSLVNIKKILFVQKRKFVLVRTRKTTLFFLPVLQRKRCN